MTEADFQTKFNKWLYGHWTLGSGAFELKLTKTKRIRLDAVKPHQIHGLRMSIQKLAYKIPDVGMGQKPFDCFFLESEMGYVVVGFHKPKTKTGVTFYVIPVLSWIEQSGPSLTEEECFKLCIVCDII